VTRPASSPANLEDSVNKTKRPPDYWLLVIVFTLLILGLIMVFSSSSVTAAGSAECNFDPYFFLKRQAHGH